MLRKALKSNLSEFWMAIFQSRSLLRAYQNQFVEKHVMAANLTYDLGAKSGSSPYAHILSKKGIEPVLVDMHSDSSVTQIDLEKPFLTSQQCDALLAFNVLEHLFNHSQFLDSAINSLRIGGVLYIMTPFSHPYHPDPGDFYRFTSEYFEEAVLASRFHQLTIYRVGKGRLNTVIAALTYRNRFLQFPLLFIPLAMISLLTDFSCQGSPFYLGVCIKAESKVN